MHGRVHLQYVAVVTANSPEVMAVESSDGHHYTLHHHPPPDHDLH